MGADLFHLANHLLWQVELHRVTLQLLSPVVEHQNNPDLRQELQELQSSIDQTHQLLLAIPIIRSKTS
jgi:hypothetical protein